MRKNLIVSDPDVMMGKPVVAGTRITVELIMEKPAAGETVEHILEAHPRLTREAVQAALAFAAEVLKGDVVYPIAEAAAWTCLRMKISTGKSSMRFARKDISLVTWPKWTLEFPTKLCSNSQTGKERFY